MIALFYSMREQQYFSIALTTFPVMITVLIGILIGVPGLTISGRT